MPRFIPYLVLPISSLLLTIRFVQAGWRVWKEEQELIIESHEVGDSVDPEPRDVDDLIIDKRE